MKLLGSTLFTLATALLLGAFIAGFLTWNPRITTCGIILYIGVYSIAVACLYVSAVSESDMPTFLWLNFTSIVILLTGTIFMSVVMWTAESWMVGVFVAAVAVTLLCVLY